MQKTKYTPELLAPAGSPDALRAAIEGGADAVYMGGISFNARINAKNFTSDELREGIALAHAYGVKVYIAANTLVYDREREDFLIAAEQAYLCGADALIVADIGMARELKKRIPIELHASTQLSGHNCRNAKLLQAEGFSRMVCAREMSRDDLISFCKNSPIEAEVFVHGALCVSNSGQCLFSSVVGGRSGNRGECAQPCRLPYEIGGKQSYPLSLRDLSLATHIGELCDMGVASFKIEGRMKSPEYVRDVTRIWRRLIDERRDADNEDMQELAKIFSRGGFTDGYYTKNINSSMLGVRSQDDKNASAEASENKFDKISRKIPISFKVNIYDGKPAELIAVCGETTVAVQGQIPERAITAPLGKESVFKNISKLGATPYVLNSVEICLDEGLMLPVSALNSLRRAAIERLQGEIAPQRSLTDIKKQPFDKADRPNINTRSAVFYDAQQIPDEAKDYFDMIFVPLEQFEAGKANGVMLPETVFDLQEGEIAELLRKAENSGARYALIGNIGHVSLVKENAPSLQLYGDFRLNICNSSSAARIAELGLEDFVLSPELSLAQMRDIGGRAIIYGRIPLMLTQKCIGKELGGCHKCESGRTELNDRRGVKFPVRRRYGHRSVIFNSVPIYMADRKREIERNRLGEHFVFTVESKSEAARVIDAYKKEKVFDGGVKRLK